MRPRRRPPPPLPEPEATTTEPFTFPPGHRAGSSCRRRHGPRHRVYGDLFGWTSEASRPEYGGYIGFASDGDGVAGGMPCDEDNPAKNTWTVYLRVDDIGATTAAAKAAGAQVALEPMQVGPLGSMAVIMTGRRRRRTVADRRAPRFRRPRPLPRAGLVRAAVDQLRRHDPLLHRRARLGHPDHERQPRVPLLDVRRRDRGTRRHHGRRQHADGMSSAGWLVYSWSRTPTRRSPRPSSWAARAPSTCTTRLSVGSHSSPTRRAPASWSSPIALAERRGPRPDRADGASSMQRVGRRIGDQAPDIWIGGGLGGEIFAELALEELASCVSGHGSCSSTMCSGTLNGARCWRRGPAARFGR